MFNRLNRALQQALDPDKVGRVTERQPTIETVLPGDVVSTWDLGDCVVEASLECEENLNGRLTHWRWNLLDGGRLLETAPDANVLYGRTEVLFQDSAGFEMLTSEPDDEGGGVLKTFEDRVRKGIAARNPTFFAHGDRVYRVLSTGTFLGRPAEGRTMPRAEVWRDIHPTNPGENVYFELEPTEENEDDTPDSVVLGVWTTHIALLFGKRINSADIQSIYPRAIEETHAGGTKPGSGQGPRRGQEGINDT